MSLIWLSGLISIVSSVPSLDCQSGYWWNSNSNESPYTVQSGGLTREYYVAYDDSFLINEATYEYPVTLVLHSYLATAEGVAQQTRFHLSAVPAGHLVVYPEGYKKSWNAGACCGPAKETNDNIDDVGFLMDDLLNDIQNGATGPSIPINTNKIYATGHSNGAHMAYRIACQRPLEITAIATSAGTPKFVDVESCKCNGVYPKCWDYTKPFNTNKCDRDKWYTELPQQLYSCDMSQRVVPIMGFVGKADSINLWQGGKQKLLLETTLPFIDEARWYANMAECTDWNYNILSIFNGQNDPLRSYYNDIGNGDVATCITFQGNCDAEVTYCTVDIGEHTWPNGYSISTAFCNPLKCTRVGTDCDAGICDDVVGDCRDGIAMSVDASVRILSFFNQQSL